MRSVHTWEDTRPNYRRMPCPEPEAVRALRNKDAEAIRHYRLVCKMSEENLIRIYGNRAVREALHGVSDAE